REIVADARRPATAGKPGSTSFGGAVRGFARPASRDTDRTGLRRRNRNRDGRSGQCGRRQGPGKRDARDLGGEDHREDRREQESTGSGASGCHVPRIGKRTLGLRGPVVPPPTGRWCLLSQRSGWVRDSPVRNGSVAGSG